MSGGSIRFIYNYEAGIHKEYSVNLFDRFLSKAPKTPHVYCPISEFRIIKVIKTGTNELVKESEWSQWFSVDNSGVFKILKFKELA